MSDPHDGGLVVGEVDRVHDALQVWAFFSMIAPSALFGGPNSPVTANLPAAKIFSRLLPALYPSSSYRLRLLPDDLRRPPEVDFASPSAG